MKFHFSGLSRDFYNYYASNWFENQLISCLEGLFPITKLQNVKIFPRVLLRLETIKTRSFKSLFKVFDLFLATISLCCCTMQMQSFFEGGEGINLQYQYFFIRALGVMCIVLYIVQQVDKKCCSKLAGRASVAVARARARARARRESKEQRHPVHVGK